MPFVISAGTLVTGFGIGIQSVNYNDSPQIQRLYQLGSGVPFDRNIINQKNLQLTRYAGSPAPGTPFEVLASTSCDDSTSFVIAINVISCYPLSVSETWWPTSYSYSKDVQGWGVESWSFVSKPEVINGDGAVARMIRGTAEGQTTTDGGAETGVVFLATQVPGKTMQVSAGQPGIGNAFNVSYGEIHYIGGGTGKADGRMGNASVSIPYSPIFML